MFRRLIQNLIKKYQTTILIIPASSSSSSSSQNKNGRLLGVNIWHRKRQSKLFVLLQNRRMSPRRKVLQSAQQADIQSDGAAQKLVPESAEHIASVERAAVHRPDERRGAAAAL